MTKRIAKWIEDQLISRTWVGCHVLLKSNCVQLMHWIRAKANGLKCTMREPWIATTKGGFPLLFSGLEEMSTEVQLCITALHKVFKPSSPDELPKKAVRTQLEYVTKPYSASKSAITEALSLIQVGIRHLRLSEFDDYSMDCGSVYDPNHEVRPEGLKWLHSFYKANEYWLAPVEGAQCFYPFDPTKEPEAGGTGVYEFLTREGNVSSFVDPSYSWMGDYQLSPKPGLKARAYFCPNLLIQAVAEPMFRFFESIEKKCGYSVRYLESEAKVSQTQIWLAEGAVVSSIDQTAATDRFPLRLQLFTAHLLGTPPEYIRAISKISRGKWHVNDSLRKWCRKDTIKLAVGQPMGVNFSMPLYTLSMIALLRGACDRWGFSPDFLVLGDDLVVRDSGLARWVHDFLPSIGVKINEGKGVTSSNIANFCGAHITADSFIYPGEMPEVDEDSWYNCSVKFAQPLPDGCPKAVSREKLGEAFWLSRVAALGCFGKPSCPIGNSKAANQVISDQCFTEDQLDQLADRHLEYDIRRLRDSARSLRGQILKGKLSSTMAATRRILKDFVHENVLYDVCLREDDLLRRGFKADLTRSCFELFDTLGQSDAVGLESWLKPKGETVELWVAHVLSRLNDLLTLDAPNWSVRRTRIACRILVSSLSDVLDRLRQFLWERRGPEFKRHQKRSSSFCHYLVTV